MGETFRVSVRELVAFLIFRPRISCPAEDAERHAGRRTGAPCAAGTARRGRAKRAIRHMPFPCLGADRDRLWPHGRCLSDGPMCRFVEEMKLSAQARPDAPLPEHWAQALCATAAMAGARKSTLRTWNAAVTCAERGRSSAAALSATRKRLTGTTLAALRFESLAGAHGLACALRESGHYRRERDASHPGARTFPIRKPTERASGSWPCRCIPPSGAKSGCSPACPPARARARQCCIPR